MKKLKKLVSSKLYLFYFISSILIVYMHSNPLQWGIRSNTGGICSYIDSFFQTLSCTAVPFFFVASGFLLYKDLTFDHIKLTIKKKIRRYGVPYLAWSVICFLLMDHLRNMQYKYIPLYLLTSSFDGALWFIEVLIFLVLLSPVFLWIFRSKKVSILVLVLLFIFSYYINIPISGSSIEVILLSPFQEHLKIAFPYYFLGGFLGKFYFDNINKEKYYSRILSVVLSVCLLILYGQYFNNFPVRITGIVYVILLQAQAVFWWMILPSKIFNYKDHWWYHRTFFTYAAQWIFIWGVAKVLDYFHLMGRYVSFYKLFGLRVLISIFIVIITILLGQLFYIYLPKAYLFLTEGRVKK